jgi:twinkle protein
VGHEACPECGSQDNLGRYADGHASCFGAGCDYYEKAGSEAHPSVPRVSGLWWGEPLALTMRGIELETCQKFRYLQGDGVQLATYFDKSGQPCAQKVRHPDKSFSWTGEPKRAVLFGQQLWGEGGKRVVVTEGEIDALSMAQALKLRWPVVSIPNGASGARKDLAKNLEWLETFREIVLMFDEDEPGRAAAAECAELFTPGKVKIARLSLKDPNEMLLQGRIGELVRACWEAKAWRPDGIVAGVDLIERILAPPPPSIPYPWPGLNTYLRGQRRGEVTTWCGGTGAGKSQLVREIAYDLRVRGERLGVIALEESTRHAGLQQVALQMGVRLHDPVIRERVADEAIRAAAQTALDGMYFYEHFGSVEASVLLPKIRFMAKALDVRWFILDHVSIMVSGTATEGDERKRIDELMTSLRTTVENLDIGLHIISHLRKANGTPFEEGGRITADDLRGSGAIKQISNNIIAAERNQQAEDEDEKNTSTLRVLKNRVFGDTGIAARVLYSKATGRTTEEGLPFRKESSDDPQGDF